MYKSLQRIGLESCEIGSRNTRWSPSPYETKKKRGKSSAKQRPIVATKGGPGLEPLAFFLIDQPASQTQVDTIDPGPLGVFQYYHHAIMVGAGIGSIIHR